MGRRKAIRVLLADDHAFVREGIRMHLADERDLELVGEAANGKEAIEQAMALEPDILLLDIRMPETDGLGVARALKDTGLTTKIIAFTMHDNRKYVLDIVGLGAQGYLTKDVAPSELVEAIKAVHSGKSFFSRRISGEVLGEYVRHAGTIEKIAAGALSKRETEVLSLIAKGSTNKEIGRCFGISARTIEAHRARIREKLNLDTTADLVKYAVANGIVMDEDG